MENTNNFISSILNFKKVSWSKKRILILAISILIITMFFYGKKLPIFNSTSNQALVLGNNKEDIKPVKFLKQIEKDFSFPIKNEKDQEISKIKFFVENAEIRDEIIIKGQRAEAIKGRTFLIINIKVTNEHNETIQINTRDYVRLQGNGNELLAPDIHNDPVEIQAISTKYTRLGFPVDDNVKGFKLQIGEIKGNKTSIDINF